MRTLLVINAVLDQTLEAAIARGERPRKDYLELQSRLGATILDLTAVRRHWWTRLLVRVGGMGTAQAALAWRWSGNYDAVFADRETTGCIVGALNRLRRRRPRLVMIAHLLTPPKKRLLLRFAGIRYTVDCLIVHSTIQQQAALTQFGLRADQVALLPYQTDTRFWAPGAAASGQEISSAGLEYRDYATLIDAVRDLDVKVTIAAASHWSRHQSGISRQGLPPNIRVASLGPAELRDVYAASRFVVVPLHDVDNQAGITTILEAMSMGKAVIVSHTQGQTDVVRDRRGHSRSNAQRATQPDWARLLGASDRASTGHNGMYVRPSDANELRRSILFLLRRPGEADTMGANGRKMVVETMGLEHFVDRVAAIIGGSPAKPRDTANEITSGYESALPSPLGHGSRLQRRSHP